MEIVFLLLKPENPANIGAACRAMKTMGHNDLRLIEPCDYLSLRARALAHQSEDLLESAKVYSCFNEATKDCDFIVGTTARHRKVKLDYVDSDEVMNVIHAKGDKIRKVCFVFGGERSGLSTAHLLACDVACTIPTATKFPSLNLSQSVMLLAYLARTNLAKIQTKDWRINEGVPQEDHFQALKASLSALIDDLDMKDPTKLKKRVLSAIGKLGSDDIDLVHTVRRRFQNRIDNLKSKLRRE